MAVQSISYRYDIKLIQSQPYKSLFKFYIADKSINWYGFQFALKIYYMFTKFQALLIVTIFSFIPLKDFYFYFGRVRAHHENESLSRGRVDFAIEIPGRRSWRMKKRFLFARLCTDEPDVITAHSYAKISTIVSTFIGEPVVHRSFPSGTPKIN